MKKRGYLQISFAWLFAIIVGAFILFLAIYASTKLMGTEQETLDAKTGKEVGILLNPLETGFGTTAKVTFFTMPVETRIYNKCNNNGMFGKQIIQISQKSFNKWTDTEIDIGFSNKYIFSEREIKGKKFYVFSKPFDFPFKVSDLIYMISSLKEYCFINPPEDIEDEISELKQKNLLLEDDEDCNKSIQVCFGGGSDCNITVYSNYIEKDEKTIHFEGDALMYAAVFADAEIYECQLKRLMKRTGHLALLYEDKASFISQTAGCSSNLNQDLLYLSNSVDDLDSSSYLSSIDVESIKNKNEANWECRLW